MRYKSLVLAIVLILQLFPVVAEEPAQQVDTTVLRFIQQEELKTRSEIKAYTDEALKTDREETQKMIDDNKRIIWKEVDSAIRKVVVRLGIVWFIATLTAMICYRFILMQVKRKFIKKGLRDEYTG